MPSFPPRPRIALAGLALALAASAAQAAATWERKVEFARGLIARSDRENAESTLDSLAADPTIPPPEQPDLLVALGDCWTDLVARQGGGTAGLQGAIRCLGKARALLARFAELPTVKEPGFPAERRVEAAMRSAWLARNIASCHARLSADKALPDPQRQEHRQEAVRNYQASAAEFAAIGAQKQDRPLAFRARLAANRVRVEHATFLKGAGAREAEWKPPAEAAAKDCRQLLFDFDGARALSEVTLTLAEALILLGNTKEAMERLEELWKARADFAHHKSVPCKARCLAASALLRQDKPRAALDALDEMLVFRTKGGGRAYNPKDPKALLPENVKALIEELDQGDEPAQFDRRDVGKALLLAAQAYAALAGKAKAAGVPADARRFFANAYQLAVGVMDADVAVDPSFVPLMEDWRREARLGPSPTLLRRRGEFAAQEGRYLDAARDFTAALAAGTNGPDESRKSWELVGECYYKGGDPYAAATVYRALARWFPRPEEAACRYASHAYSVLKELAERSGDPADQAVADEAGLEAERLSPQGPGPLHFNKALAERKAGRLDGALALLAPIRPSSSAYPRAVCEAALTRVAALDALTEAERAGPRGQQALAATMASFRELLDYAKATMPKLSGEAQAAERRRLLDPLARCLAGVCEAHLKLGAQGAARAIELAAEAEKACPGIAESPSFPSVAYARIRAADLLLAASSLDQHRTLATLALDAWGALAKHPELRGISYACWVAANACDKLAVRLDEAAKAAPEPASGDGLRKEAAAARDRGLDCYLQLVRAAPDQPIATWRRILSQLDERPHEPKSADYRLVADIGPKAIEVHKALRDALPSLSRLRITLAEVYRRQQELRPAIDLLHVESILGVTHCRLGNWREALPLLEEVHRVAEAIYQARLAIYDAEKDPARPSREAIHLQMRPWLARCYLETGMQAKYPVGHRIYAEDLPLYARDKPEYWDTLYWLCETLRREGLCEEAVKFIMRDVFRDAAMGTGIVKDGKGTKEDFRRLLVQIRQDTEQLKDPARRSALLPAAADALRQLGK